MNLLSAAWKFSILIGWKFLNKNQFNILPPNAIKERGWWISTWSNCTVVFILLEKLICVSFERLGPKTSWLTFWSAWSASVCLNRFLIFVYCSYLFWNNQKKIAFCWIEFWLAKNIDKLKQNQFYDESQKTFSQFLPIVQRDIWKGYLLRRIRRKQQ